MGGCSQCNNNPLEKPQPHLNTYTKVSNFELINHSYDHNTNYLKPKSLLMKMVWEFGFGCFVGEREKNTMISKNESKNNNNNNNIKNGKNEKNEEQNNTWLLAESGGDLANAEPYSVHSSFRFNICSQLELESVSSTGFTTSNTVLMVNLDDNVSDSYSKDVKWRRVESLEKCISPVSSSLIRFSFDEIVSATRNFSQGRVLGRGALSYVFRGRVGFLRTAVAIKRLDKEDKEAPKAFCRELMIASSLQHPNIVPLLGFCIDPDEGLFLVYKYVSSGSLEHHLHGKKKGVKGFASLSWKARYKVAVGIAEAIAYLHNGTEKCIVHRDIKPSNILLSSKKRPKLCDFGLATWTAAPSVPFLCKTVKGTFGYLAPEYFQHGKVSDKTDVYAFGVVLLELITGRKPIETTRPPGEENLVQWAKPLLNQGEATLASLLDPRAKVTPKSSKHITQMVQAASACLRNEECNRPGINEAITLLRGECCSNKGKTGLGLGLGRYGSASQRFQRSKSELRNHLTLAMLGVCELDNDDYFYSR